VPLVIEPVVTELDVSEPVDVTEPVVSEPVVSEPVVGDEEVEATPPAPPTLSSVSSRFDRPQAGTVHKAPRSASDATKTLLRAAAESPRRRWEDERCIGMIPLETGTAWPS
jgi:hypothetical protein